MAKAHAQVQPHDADVAVLDYVKVTMLSEIGKQRDVHGMVNKREGSARVLQRDYKETIKDMMMIGIHMMLDELQHAEKITQYKFVKEKTSWMPGRHHATEAPWTLARALRVGRSAIIEIRRTWLWTCGATGAKGSGIGRASVHGAGDADKFRPRCARWNGMCEAVVGDLAKFR